MAAADSTIDCTCSFVGTLSHTRDNKDGTCAYVNLVLMAASTNQIVEAPKSKIEPRIGTRNNQSIDDFCAPKVSM